MTTTNIDPKIVLHSIEQALFSQYKQAWQRRQMRGSLDPRRAYRALGGSVDVFRRKSIQEARTSAVSLVVDLSASMHWIDENQPVAPIEALCKMVDGFAEIFRGTQTNWELSGWTTGSVRYKGKKVAVQMERASERYDKARRRDAIRNGIATKLTDRMPSSYSNEIESGTLVRFKKFGHVAHNGSYAHALSSFEGGSTDDAQIYRIAMQRLAKQEETTKLIIYLGDGMGDGMPFIAKVNKDGAQHGIISFGIGLGKDARKAVQPWAFDTHVQVDNMDDLNMEAFNASAQIIKELRKERCS